MCGSFSKEELLTLANERKNFIETGTYMGDTCVIASEIFENVYSIEIVEKLYIECVKRMRTERLGNVHLYLGDSVETIPEIIEELEGTTVWFLDAHQSGPDTGNNGVEWVPLMKELDLILSLKDVTGDLIIIDDVRLFDNAWDWKGITEKNIREKFKDYEIKNFFVSDTDRLMIEL